ncbi:hypothetical protein N6A57_001307 [Campylobacter coli]|nr:hypothetical protein [Campylobacter coli]EIQ6971321.1 hypothetical protein [Campylobacter coli]EJV1297402.1 hypothetical protein [Campylobacter coli]
MDYTLFILTFVSVSLLPGLCMSLAFSLGLSLGYKNTLWMIFGELVGLALVVLCCALGIDVGGKIKFPFGKIKLP